jgi:hypothetical protein
MVVKLADGCLLAWLVWSVLRDQDYCLAHRRGLGLFTPADFVVLTGRITNGFLDPELGVLLALVALLVQLFLQLFFLSSI